LADDDKPQSFWQSLPGLLTALAAVITAVTGLVVAVLQLKPESREKPALRVERTAAPAAKAVGPEKADQTTINPANINPAVGMPAPPENPKDAIPVAAPAEIPFALAKVVITTIDNATVQVGGASFNVCSGKKALALTYGQTVPFGRMQSFEVARSGAGLAARILLVDGTSIDGLTSECDLEGRNDAGRFSSTLDKVKRVEFRR
jgi:hypothetical protein